MAPNNAYQQLVCGLGITKLILFFAILLFPSCILQEHFKSTSLGTTKTVPLFIAMPQSKTVFENVAPRVYMAVSDYFQRVGYHLVSDKDKGYVLELEIKSLSPSQRFVSPDVLLFHTTIKLELNVTLRNFAGKSVAEETFNFSTLVSKPRNPVLTDSFLSFELERLLKRSLHKVERRFRPFLIV